MFSPLFLFIFDSPTQIIFVAAIFFLLFGASRLPQLAKSLGQSRKAFRDAMREAEEEEQSDHQKLPSTIAAPQINQISDEELMAEMRRRVETKQS